MDLTGTQTFSAPMTQDTAPAVDLVQSESLAGPEGSEDKGPTHLLDQTSTLFSNRTIDQDLGAGPEEKQASNGSWEEVRRSKVISVFEILILNENVYSI